MAHAEASAKTVDAAVTAAAAQLGLRSDQVEVEVLEDPVPSTFGVIGSPARVRVTPRNPSLDASLTNGPYEPQTAEPAVPVTTDPGRLATPQASDQPLAVPNGPPPATASPQGTGGDPAPSSSEPSSVPRSSRRSYRDEPIEPEMVEADTERAGDFLEGLLDALDIDGDITTWIDEVGGHIELEGPDLNMIVGTNGETLDALQELMRLAVLRQSKRRVRLLLDINGFRARQREQLIAIVQTTVEQVIKTREEHEFQPMTPAERKVVHDAVSAIDGVHTESLGEEPNRRVIIRPT